MKTFDIFKQIRKIYENLWVNQNSDPEAPKENKCNLPPCFQQIFGASGPLLLTISVGTVMGYSAILLPQLQEPQPDGSSNNTWNRNNQSKFTVNQDESSWIASIAALTVAIGTLVGGYFLEKIGRKSTHLISCLPSLIGWLTIGLSNDLKSLIIGRTLTGLCTGMLASATGVYIGEISEPKYRGILLGGMALAVAIGLLLVHLTGTFLSWQLTAFLNILIPTIGSILLYFVPESPSWLIKNGRIEEGTESFMWFRGSSETSQDELKAMLKKQTQIKEDEEEHNKDLNAVLKPEFLKPLFISVIFFIVSQWSGPNSIAFYSVNIIKETIGDGVNEYLCTILVDIVRVIFSIVACILIQNYGRRPLAIISGIGTSVSLLSLSLYCYVIKNYYQNGQLYFIPVVALMTYVMFISIGYIALPWAMLGEILPLTNRSLGSGISAFVAYMAAFSVVKTTPVMFQKLGAEGTFLCYGVVAFVGIIFVTMCLPETKGQTLQEIEERFKKKTSRSKENNMAEIVGCDNVSYM